MTHQLIKLVSAFFFSVMAISAVQGQNASQSDREYWVHTLLKIADPVLSNLSKDQLRKNIPVGRSSSAKASSREFVTHMESVGRTIAGIAPWLELGPDKTAEGKLRDKYIKMVCKGLKNSVDPHADDYFNSTATRQILVNSAFLIQGLLQAPTQLWGNLDDKTQQRLIEQWKSTRTMKPGNNNWLLFSAMVECGLKSFGNEWNFEVIEKAISSHEQWYKGDGVYGDGENFHLDYYNSYVIHPMLLQVLKVVVKYDSSYQILLDKEWKRFVRYAEIQERMIAPDGSYPVLGRSVSYRSAAFQVLGASALFHQLPSSLKAGQVRGPASGTAPRGGWLHGRPAQRWRSKLRCWQRQSLPCWRQRWNLRPRRSRSEHRRRVPRRSGRPPSCGECVFSCVSFLSCLKHCGAEQKGTGKRTRTTKKGLFACGTAKQKDPLQWFGLFGTTNSS